MKECVLSTFHLQERRAVLAAVIGSITRDNGEGVGASVHMRRFAVKGGGVILATERAHTPCSACGLHVLCSRAVGMPHLQQALQHLRVQLVVDQHLHRQCAWKACDVTRVWLCVGRGGERTGKRSVHACTHAARCMHVCLNRPLLSGGRNCAQ